LSARSERGICEYATIAKQQVQEGVLRLSRDGRTPLTPHELFALEAVELLVDQERLSPS